MVLKIEGVTTFYPPPRTSFRYMFQLMGNKLSIWMEDRTSKEQWRKDDMAEGDYVSSANTIAGASTLDYLKCFQEILECKLDKCSDVKRTVSVSLGDHLLHLSFVVQFRFLTTTKVAKFTFTLDPVTLERIDVLEAKLRDQQEELERFRAGQAFPFARFETSNKDANTRKLLWNTIESDNFRVVDGEVMILRPGVYSVGAVVDYTVCNRRDYSALLKNKECVQKAAHCHFRSAQLSSVLQLKEGDTVSVECDGKIGHMCYFTIAQLSPEW